MKRQYKLLLLMMQGSYFTGDDDEDAQVLEMVQRLLDVLKSVSFLSVTHKIVTITTLIMTRYCVQYSTIH